MEPSRAVPPGVAIAFLICYAGLCLAGLNPWHLPESTDDITYFDLARSWAAGEGHTVQGEIINDWPPGFPLILSLPIRLGFGSLLAGKVLTVALARDVRLLRIVAIGERRGSYEEARQLYADIAPDAAAP